VSQNLDRDRPFEAQIARPVDLAHAAGADARVDPVRAQLIPAFQRHCTP